MGLDTLSIWSLRGWQHTLPAELVSYPRVWSLSSFVLLFPSTFQTSIHLLPPPKWGRTNKLASAVRYAIDFQKTSQSKRRRTERKGKGIWYLLNVEHMLRKILGHLISSSWQHCQPSIITKKKLRLKEVKKCEQTTPCPHTMLGSQRDEMQMYSDSKSYAYFTRARDPSKSIVGILLPFSNASSPWLWNISTTEWLFTETLCKLGIWQKSQRFMKFSNISVYVF